MISANDVTFIVPIYKLGIDRLNNLKFILPHIIKTGARVLVVEQVKESATSLDLKEFNSEHLLYVSKSEEFHKTGIINWAVKNHANTKYVWVNDVDFYMKFVNALGVEWTEDFIKPYSAGKKLTSDDSTRILRGEKLNVSYEDESAQYISLYGALSFIFKKNAFLNIGGMDESLFGWGKEDIEFDRRLKSKNIFVQEIDHKGIHLWHPIEDSSSKTFENMDMAVITCHFNWCNYISPVRNLNRFLYQMEVQGIPVYGVELSLTDEFSTIGRPNWKQIKVGKQNICFQKEACINLAEKMIPDKFKKIAWIDADLYFNNQNWYSDTSKKLDQYKLVQMFEYIIETDRRGNVTAKKQSTVFLGGPTKTGGWNGPPGGALAARRDFWKNGGLYPYSFLGSSDYIFINTVYNLPINALTKETSSKKYKEWKEKIQFYLSKDDISYIGSGILHEWHGDKSGRNYQERNLITEKINYDTDIWLNDSGILEISKDKISIANENFEYFNNRNEDGVVNLTTDKKCKESKKDMAVICCFFNWSGFLSPQRNLQRFKWQMESKNIPFYGIELSLTDKFVSEEWKNWTRIKVYNKNVCFQKEAGINALEKIIPEEYTKIAWIDPDLNFANENWYSDASSVLDRYKVVQLFDRYLATDRYGKEVVNIPSMMKAGGPCAKVPDRVHSGQTGAAWAARREMWKCGGLYPYSILGGGDSTFVYSMFDAETDDKVMELGGVFDINFETYSGWKNSVSSYVNKEVHYVTGQIRHEWHGDLNKRNYDRRYDIIKGVNFKDSVQVGRNGLMEIVNVDESVYMGIINYFKSRDEDGKYLK